MSDDPNFTPENAGVSRADIQNLVDVGTPLPELQTILLSKNLSQFEVDKILSDIDSYT